MEIILLAAATAGDIFAAVLGLSVSGIRFPPRAAAAVSFTGAAVLWLSASLSAAADRLVSFDGALYISKAALFIIGLYTVIGSFLKKGGSSPYSCADVMNDPLIADCDRSKSISAKEAAALGIALSADSVFTGISAGVGGMSPPLIFIWSLIFGMAACLGGNAAGRFIQKGSGRYIPPGRIGGIVLMLLSVLL